MPDQPAPRDSLRPVLTGLGLGALLVVVGLLAWQGTQVLLVAFSAILLAILLDGLAVYLRRYARLGRATSLVLVTVALIGVVIGFGWAAGPQINTQATQLAERLPTAFERAQEVVEAHPWGRLLMRSAPAPAEIVPSTADIVGRISGVFSTTLGAVVNFAIVLVMGFYLALEPEIYQRGTVALFKPARRDQAREILGALCRALRWWLVGRVAAMAAVGVLTAIGLALIGMPLVLALALIAGLLSFIPFVGPILSAIPAVLIAMVESPLTALYVVAVYSGVQFLEGNFITPIIQKRAVSLPPAVLITSQLLFGVLFGFLGVLLATPITVVIIVLVQMLYIREILGAQIQVLGHHQQGKGDGGSSG